MLDLSAELRLPLPAVAKCLLDFGLVRTVSQELAETEIALVRENAESLRSREFVRGKNAPPSPPGAGPGAVGVREPRRPRPSAGAATVVLPPPEAELEEASDPTAF
jgi:hypothetical protein